METDAANRDLGFDPATLDCVVLSHAHIDHSGLIPYIVKMGFKGDIYCTPATRDLCALMLADTAFIQEQDVRTYNKKIDKQNPHKEKGKKYKIEPLYDQKDVNKAMKHFVTYSYERRFRLFDDVLLTFTNSGHMLGGAICSLEIYEEDKSFSERSERSFSDNGLSVEDGLSAKRSVKFDLHRGRRTSALSYTPASATIPAMRLPHL